MEREWEREWERHMSENDKNWLIEKYKKQSKK